MGRYIENIVDVSPISVSVLYRHFRYRFFIYRYHISDKWNCHIFPTF